jgi:hypothetical protein
MLIYMWARLMFGVRRHLVKNTVLLGVGRFMIPIPRVIWYKMLSREAGRALQAASLLPEEYHRVRDFVVREMSRSDGPLSREAIGSAVNIPQDRLGGILDELEERKIYLFRNLEGAVSWAYPATADRTPHAVTFSTGEDGFAA